MTRGDAKTWAMVALAMMLSLHGLSESAVASVAVVVPEISPGSVSGGLALLAGGILMLRARRRSK